MKHALLLLSALAALAACDRSAPRAQDVETRRIAEAADDNQQRKPLPDSSLTQIVKAALISDSSLDANKIDVENKAGNVALYGSVETPAQRERAERIVMSVGGVRSVANNLAINEESAGRGGR
ncbi:MAG TPA: BON domain-containing protein [Burkholderiales bacterium]